MARGRRRIRREVKTPGRPSIFFIVALAIGLIIIAWFFFQTIQHPVNQGVQPAKHTEIHHKGHEGDEGLIKIFTSSPSSPLR